MKSKILLAVALLLAISTTTVWAADSSEKTNQKTGSYTNEDVWAAYEGFNNTLLDPDKYIYKTTSSYEQAVDRGHGAAAIWCQPIYWDMSMNAYKLAKAQKDKRKEPITKSSAKRYSLEIKPNIVTLISIIIMKIPDGLSMMISCGGRSLWHVHTNCLVWMNI